MVQFSHPYMTTRKTIAFTTRTFVGKVMSLLFKMLSSLVMATHSSTLAWKIPWTEEPSRLQYMGSQRVRHDWATSLHFTSSLVIAFLPRSKRLLISWLQSPSAVIFESEKIKSVTVSIVFPPICHEVMGPNATIFVFWMLNFFSHLFSLVGG